MFLCLCEYACVFLWMCLCVLRLEFEQKLHLKQQCSKIDLSLLQSRYWRVLAQHLHPAAASRLIIEMQDHLAWSSRLIIEICKMPPRTHNLGTRSSVAIFAFYLATLLLSKCREGWEGYKVEYSNMWFSVAALNVVQVLFRVKIANLYHLQEHKFDLFSNMPP